MQLKLTNSKGDEYKTDDPMRASVLVRLGWAVECEQEEEEEALLPPLLQGWPEFAPEAEVACEPEPPPQQSHWRYLVLVFLLAVACALLIGSCTGAVLSGPVFIDPKM